MANETYTLIQTIQLNASASSITFSNIPQTFSDLIVKASLRDTRTSSGPGYIHLNFNGSSSDFGTRVLRNDDGSIASTSRSDDYVGFSGATDAQTANTFGSFEMYISDYASTSLLKPFSIDSTNETNATTPIGQNWVAGMWANTAAITSISLIPETSSSLLWKQYSSISLYGVARLGVTPTGTAKASGGDVVTNDGTYWYHAFKSSGAFTPFAALSCQALVIAGGGGGGGNHGGGGGAGGVSYNSSMSALAQTYPVIIGGGGSGAVDFNGTAGINSSFNSIISNGGGIGSNSSNPSNTLYPGGSGGGGIAFVSNPGGLATQGNTGGATGYGNNGGTGGGYSSGGGGGAGGVGGNGSGNTGGTGGAGLNTWSAWASATSTGASGYYAGGAGGFSNGSGGSAGGSGGGGIGGTSIYYGGTGVGGTGVANTGSGGGGTVGSGYGGTAGNGGSGIVIIRYAM